MYCMVVQCRCRLEIAANDPHRDSVAPQRLTAEVLPHGRVGPIWEQFELNTGIRPVFVDLSYLMIIEGAYRCLQAPVSHWSVDAEA